MKKFVNIALVTTFLFGTLTSCEDFLQKDPPASPSESIYWQKKSDFESALVGCYSTMYNGPLSVSIPCLDNLTDNTISEHDSYDYGFTKSMAQGDVDPSKGGFIQNYYRHCYEAIARVHILLKNLDNYKGNDMTDTEKSYLRGQALALRGYMYSWLYMCYREVPLVTENLDLDNMYQPKSTRPEIFNQIIADFDDAITLLPDMTYTEFPGRFTVSAVKALRARVMLYTAYDEEGNATDAEKLKEVVSSLESIKGYTLTKTSRENFLPEKQESSSEIMFSVKFLHPNLRNNIYTWYGVWHVTMPTLNLINEFECADGLKWGESPLTVDIDEDLLIADGEEGINERKKLLQNRDPRINQAIIEGQGMYFPADKGYEGIFVPTIAPSPNHFNSIKLVAPQKVMISNATVQDADIVILRYAEVLMMMAEAENELNGPTSKVYNWVNTIRARSNMPELPAGLSKEEMRERIRHEWRVEFCFEGLRYFQLKRWNLLEKNVNGLVDPSLPEYKKVFKPAFKYWPLPQSEIDKANGVLVQDPNYI